MPPSHPEFPDHEGPPPRPRFADERPAAAEDLAAWCRDLGRMLHLARRNGPGHDDTRALRARLVAELVPHVREHAPFELGVTPRALVLGDDAVFTAEHANAEAGEGSLEHELPAVLHRDGVRVLRFAPGLTQAEAAALLDALLAAAPASATDEDLVTLLWQAGLTHLSWSTEEVGAVRDNPLSAPRDLLGASHADDWPLPEAPGADVRRLWDELQRQEESHQAAFAAQWRAEHAGAFPARAAAFVEAVLTRDPRRPSADALAAALVTWIATALQRSDWDEALEAHALLERVDPDGRRSAESLTHAFGSVDGGTISDRLDEADAREQSRLFAFTVRVGAPALPLLLTVLARSGKARVRAGATTALAYAFAEDPAPLGPWLTDTRWHVVRNLVFVLGQIGGPGVVPHLAVAARHVDARVRRAAIHALGQVPHALRRSVLLGQLDTADGRLLAATLAMLSREPDARVTEALLARVHAADFESRPEQHKIGIITALADVAGERVVPELEALLGRGGWFARRSPERTAAARTLARIGTAASRSVLEQGLRHRSEAVREACDEALRSWGRP